MISLLHTIDRKRYDVTLWIASSQGVFMPQIPSDVKVISDFRITALGNGVFGVLQLLKHLKFGLALGSSLRMFLSLLGLKSWAARLLAQLMPVIGKNEYDLIVDYNGQQQLYYMVNKLKGKCKVTFFHSDYSKWSYYYAADKFFFQKVDRIFTISPYCVKILKEWFPEQKEKIHLMENITSPELINTWADMPVDFQWQPKAIRLVTVGHVMDSKGAHWAIEAAHILKERGWNIQWVFVGTVHNQIRYDKMIQQWSLQENITFTGAVPNPYPYMKTAEILVHPSQFEGKSIALDEAKILGKPIVVTNFSTVRDQFENGINATICDMNPKSIAKALENLIKDNDLRESYRLNLLQNSYDNSSEINKIYEILSTIE